MALDEDHLAAALSYITLNPVRARLVERATDGPWSSMHVHLGLGVGDGLTTKAPVLSRYPDFDGLIAGGEDEALSMKRRRAESIGRPLGDDAFLAKMENEGGRTLRPAKRGRRPKLSALSP